jgi:transposase
MLGRPNKLAPYLEFLRERVTAFPDLTAARLTREIRELGYMGAYAAVKRFLAAIRPENWPKPFEVRFETPPGVQGQRDCPSHSIAQAAKQIAKPAPKTGIFKRSLIDLAARPVVTHR